MAKELRRAASPGLLITPQALVVVQARETGGRMEVLVRGAMEMPPDTMSGSDVQDPVRLGHAIRALWRRTSIESRTATVTLLAPAYGMRALHLPVVPERERRSLVRGELEQAKALPYGAGAFDFLWLAPPDTGGATQADVYAYTISDAAVDGVKSALKTAGLELDGLEPGSIAMIRACLAARESKEPIALLCPSDKHTDLCIHDGTRVTQLRRIPAGWDDIAAHDEEGTRGILPDPDAWRIGPDIEPQRYLDRWELPAVPGKGDAEDVAAAPPADDSAEEAFPVMQPATPTGAARARPTREGEGALSGRAQFLLSEIERSLAFYKREFPQQAHPRTVVVLAPGTVPDDFRTVLGSALDLPVQVPDPVALLDLPRAAVSIEAGDEPGAYLAPAGAAARHFGAQFGLPTVDVSQQEAAAAIRRRAPQVIRAGMAWSTAWLALAAATALVLTLLQGRATDEKARLMDEIARINAQRAPILRLYELSLAAKASQDMSQVPAAAVLGRVAASATTGVGLTNLRVAADGKVTLEGRATDTNSVRLFALRLGLGNSVRLPVIETTKRDQTGQLTFRITGSFRQQAPVAALQDVKE